jgi:hypothetical protein
MGSALLSELRDRIEVAAGPGTYVLVAFVGTVAFVWLIVFPITLFFYAKKRKDKLKDMDREENLRGDEESGNEPPAPDHITETTTPVSFIEAERLALEKYNMLKTLKSNKDRFSVAQLFTSLLSLIRKLNPFRSDGDLRAVLEGNLSRKKYIIELTKQVRERDERKAILRGQLDVYPIPTATTSSTVRCPL